MNLNSPRRIITIGRDRALRKIFADRFVVARAAAQMGREATSIDGDPERLRVPAGDVDQRRHDIDERDARADAAWRKAAGAGDDKRARGSRPRRSSSCTKGRARRAFRRDRW